MIVLIILLGIYILGILVLRHIIAEYEPSPCVWDVLMCFIPIIHWVYAIIEWINYADYSGSADNVTNKFFGKRK